MNQLGLLFTATECNGWPSIKIFINEQLVEDHKFSTSSALINIPLASTVEQHVLTIEFYGKTQNNTKLVDGAIVEDQLVTLDTIFVDDTPVPEFVKYRGIYTTGINQHPQILTWGVPGNWQLQFACPIINWILELKSEQEYNTADQSEWITATHNMKKTETLLAGFRELEKVLSDVKI